MNDETLTFDDIVKKTKELAEKNNLKYVKQREFIKEYKISARTLFNIPNLNLWTDVTKAAGLEASPTAYIETETILKELYEAAKQSKGNFSLVVICKLAKRNSTLYKKRFHNWGNALIALRDWIKKNNKEFPYLDALDKKINERSGETTSKNETIKQDKKNLADYTPPKGTIQFGDTLNFRNFRHEPISEKGVLVLFGMVAKELGFIIDLVQDPCPDCMGMRRTNNGKWVPVNIEFELKSRNFTGHTHEVEKVDLIVCWKHNWKDCPIEVLELKAEIKKLKNTE